MANNIETPNTTFNNDNTFSDFSTMSQCNWVTYVADVAHIARFILLTDAFIAQLYNFPSLKTDGLHIIRSIIYKPELKKTWNLFQKAKKYICILQSIRIIL